MRNDASQSRQIAIDFPELTATRLADESDAQVVHVDLSRRPNLTPAPRQTPRGRILTDLPALFDKAELAPEHDRDYLDNLGDPVYGPEGQALLRDFFEMRGVRSLNTDDMYYDPWQVKCFEEVLAPFMEKKGERYSMNDNAVKHERHAYLVRAPTGSGKSVALMQLIAWALDHELPVLITTPQEALVRQIGRFARTFLNLPDQAVAVLPHTAHDVTLVSGDLASPQERARLYADPMRRLFIATPHVIWNDVQSVDSQGRPRSPILSLERFWMMGIDETHHGFGNDPLSNLARYVVKDIKLAVAMSATPASTQERIRVLQERFSLARYLRFKPKRIPWRERRVRVSLKGPQWERHRRALFLLKQSALDIEYRLDRLREAQRLSLPFLELKPVSLKSRRIDQYRFPSADEIKERIAQLENEFPILRDRQRARSYYEGLRQRKRYYDIIENLGGLAFLFAAGRSLSALCLEFSTPFQVKRSQDGALSCTPLSLNTAQHKTPKPERRRWWEYDLARDKRLREAFRVLAQGTPLHHILTAQRWGQLFVRSQCGSAGEVKTRGAALRNFFRAARKQYVAEVGFNDHPKLIEVSREILAFAQSRPGERVIVSTPLREYTVYYKHFIDYHFGPLWGLRATAITGKGAHATDPLSASGQHARFEEFRHHSPVGVITRVGEEGHDVPKASLVIVTRVNKEPVRIQQLRGRAGRPSSTEGKSARTAEIVYLIDQDGLDEYVLNAGLRKIREMER